jgi:hypothetical protein
MPDLLPVVVREDTEAEPSGLATAIVSLVLDRARRAVAQKRSRPAPLAGTVPADAIDSPEDPRQEAGKD